MGQVFAETSENKAAAFREEETEEAEERVHSIPAGAADVESRRTVGVWRIFPQEQTEGRR